jgi:cytochrome b
MTRTPALKLSVSKPDTFMKGAPQMSDINDSTVKLVPVWDIAVRLFHWSLVLCVTAAWLLTDNRDVHEFLGYTAAGLVAFRLVWGVIGTRYARFTSFVTGPRRVLGYLRDMVRGREERYLGHNPAGAAMIIALIFTILALGVTGYMMGMTRYFGQDWVEDVHEFFANFLLVLVALHIGGVLIASLRHRENLVRSMVTGLKAADDPDPHQPDPATRA